MPELVSWSPNTATVIVPLRTLNELNDHTHWRKRHKRSCEQRLTVCAYLNQLGQDFRRDLVTYVDFVRVAPGQGLDPGDNLNSSMKYVRDQIAAYLAGNNTPEGKGDDGPKCGVRWSYQQRRATQWGVEIRMSSFPFRLELAL
jgi:hypothetical protein